jgi:hypothetical protein
MSEQGGIFVTVLSVLEQMQIPYMITGSVASVRYGEARTTLDMDLIVDLTLTQASRLARAFSIDYYADQQSIQEAVRTRGHFNIIHGASGVKVDFFFVQDSPYARQAFQRKRRDKLTATFSAYFMSPEDVILGKLTYYQAGGSEKHLRDVRGILRTTRETLDTAYLERCAAQLGVLALWDTLAYDKDK